MNKNELEIIKAKKAKYEQYALQETVEGRAATNEETKQEHYTQANLLWAKVTVLEDLLDELGA